jgi:hypothetical protein
LCARIYDTLDGLVNGVDGAFKDFTQTSWKSFIWIQFYNSKIENKTRTKNLHIYEQFLVINKEWTPIEKKIIEIQIGSNPSHISQEFNSLYNQWQLIPYIMRKVNTWLFSIWPNRCNKT